MSLSGGHKRRQILLRFAAGTLLVTCFLPSISSAETLDGYTPPPMFGGAAPTPAPQQPQPSPAPVAKPKAPLMAPITEGDPLNRNRAHRQAAQPAPAARTLRVPVHEPKKPQVIATRANETIPRPTVKPTVPASFAAAPKEGVKEVKEEPVVNQVPEPEELAAPAPTEMPQPQMQAEAHEDPIADLIEKADVSPSPAPEPTPQTQPDKPKVSMDVRVPESDFMMDGALPVTGSSISAAPAKIYKGGPVKLKPASEVTCAWDAQTEKLLLPPDPIVGEDMSSGRRVYGSPKPALKPLMDPLIKEKYVEANTPPPVEITGEQTKKAGYADVEAAPLPITDADIKRAEGLVCKMEPMSAAKTRVIFPAGETITIEGSEEVMREVVKQLQEHSGGKLYIQAYASKAEGQEEIDARRLSLARGLAVRAWIMKQGIFPSRIEIKAMGSMSGEPQSDFVDLIVRE